jgi:hypothetical protein
MSTDFLDGDTPVRIDSKRDAEEAVGGLRAVAKQLKDADKLRGEELTKLGAKVVEIQRAIAESQTRDVGSVGGKDSGKGLGGAMMQSMMTDMEQELGMESEPSEELPVVAIKIEKSGDMLYAFRKDTDQFLGQGTTGQALIERMSETMRDVKLVVAKEDGGEFLGNQNFTYDTASKVFSQE